MFVLKLRYLGSPNMELRFAIQISFIRQLRSWNPLRNHCFIDGNKRTTIALAGIFLRLNGYDLQTGQKELERFTLSVAAGGTSFDSVLAWSRKHAPEQKSKE